MEARSLVQSGLGSFVLSIPKKWLDQHKLRKGDIVYVEQQGNTLILFPGKPKKEKKSRRYTLSARASVEVLTRQLLTAYLEGYEEIVLEGSRDTVLETMLCNEVNDLAGLEIVEKTNTRIVINDLLKLEQVSVKETFKKMDMTLRMMFSEFCSMLMQGLQTPEVLEAEDRLINKLHWLISRFLRAVLKNELPDTEMTDLYDAFILSQLSLAMEGLGDHVKHIAKDVKAFPSQQQQTLIKTMNRLKQIYVGLIESYYKKEYTLAYVHVNDHAGLIEHCRTLFGKNPNPEATVVATRLVFLVEAIANIAKALRYRELQNPQFLRLPM